MAGLIVLIVAIVLFVLAVTYLVTDFLLSKLEIKSHPNRVYRALYEYADENDHLLLNNVDLFLPGDYSEPTRFDHILFADKYIYIVTDFALKGGLYGNINDPNFFVKKLNGQAQQVHNPIPISENNIARFESLLDVNHEDKMLVSVIVYNNSLVVPEALRKMNRNCWFLSLKELIPTIRKAEKDNVTPIPHEMTQAMLDTIKARSENIKEALARQEEQRKAGAAQ
jgi:hypothetical protein